MMPVRDQGQCGSCWAFSTLAVVEGNWQIAKKVKLPSWLSTQHLVDCDTSDSGCDGGWFSSAMTYLKTNYISFDSKYPYTSGDSGNAGTCQYTKGSPNAGILLKSYKSVTTADTVYALLKLGPVSVAIDANDDFMNYSSGIWGAACSDQINHAVTLVGYGSTGSVGYWIIRNSWSADWGLLGYVHVQDNATNANSCNIGSNGFQPGF